MPIDYHSLVKNLRQCLISDCTRCSGLCCTALYFAQSEGFPADKMPGVPCHNLQHDFRCAIHQDLLSYGMKGCLSYDCCGAGQKVTSEIYQGKNWFREPELASEIFQVFMVVWQLQQILWYLTEALSLATTSTQQKAIKQHIDENQQQTKLPPEHILTFDLSAYRDKVNQQLKYIGQEVQQKWQRKPQKQRKQVDFIGKSFRNMELAGRDFSMTLLIAADFSGCQLAGINFLGADLRDANFCDADLSQSIFLTQMQINAARGNQNTRLAAFLQRPLTWQ